MNVFILQISSDTLEFLSQKRSFSMRTESIQTASKVIDPEPSNTPSSHSPTNQKIETVVQSLLNEGDGFDWQLRPLQFPSPYLSTRDHEGLKRKRDEIPFDSRLQLASISKRPRLEEPERRLCENKFPRNQTGLQPQQYKFSQFSDQPIESTSSRREEIVPKATLLESHSKSSGMQENQKISQKEYRSFQYDKTCRAPLLAIGEKPGASLSAQATALKIRKTMRTKAEKDPIEKDRIARVDGFVRQYLENPNICLHNCLPKRYREPKVKEL
jgi:hypothetical protein